MSKSSGVALIKTAAFPKDFPRSELPEVAAVGRSNVGKSSLLNRLVGVKGLAFVSKTPGRTQVANFFQVSSQFVLVDLPGYGFAKVPVAVRRNWEELVTAYLFEREQLALVLLLVDLRREPMESDLQVRDLLEEASVEYTIVATKADKVPRGRRQGAFAKLRGAYGSAERAPIIPFSAVTNEGRKELWTRIERQVREARRPPRK
jgi:GTP-binding protein